MSSTRTPLTGNPLAVFTDARGLTDKEMQLWRKMNLSETTFVLPRR
jgi:trans-2,3-dihydro-3-hydroxyanthranilate isomerase